MKHLLHHAERLLQAHALDDGDPAPLARILERARAVELATGEVLCREGDPASEIFLVLEGRIEVAKRDHDGDERAIGMWFAPAIVGALGVVGGPLTRTATCIAAAPCTVAALDAATARSLLDDPGPEGAELRWLLLSSFTEVLANTTDRLRESLATPPAANLSTIQAALYGLKRDDDK